MSPLMLMPTLLLAFAGATFVDGAKWISRSHQKSHTLRNTAGYCAKLANQGSHSTVDIEVGTPGQKFSVVADTGSDALIIPSCLCKEHGSCRTDERCFRGTNRSKTFKMDKNAKELMLSFGSGTIDAVPMKDMVQLGKLKVYMKETGLLLMTNRALDFSGHFEGILGLGPRPPLPSEDSPGEAVVETGNDAMKVSPAMKDALRKVMEGMTGNAEITASSFIQLHLVKHDIVLETESGPGLVTEHTDNTAMGMKGLLQQANIDTFSLCFNDGTDGVLRLSLPEMTGGVDSIGTMHWAVNLTGVSIGDVSTPVQICSPANMTPGQASPCAGIPDSGTTNIMAPPDQIDMLFNSICDNWPRCIQNYTALKKAAKAVKKEVMDIYHMDPFGLDRLDVTKAQIVESLLLDCEMWMNETNDLGELPSIHLHVDGSAGNQMLELPGEYYVMESMIEDYDHVIEHLEGLGHGANSTKKTARRKVCSPAIGSFEYNTVNNGPVWILGTPIFYRYIVGYNRNPPTVSFTSTQETPCGSCQGSTFFISTNNTKAKRRPRVAKWPARKPSIDVKAPL